MQAPDPIAQFVANMPGIMSALITSGDGTRAMVKLEAFGLQAVEMQRMLMVAGKEFLVTITELSEQEKVKRMQADKPQLEDYGL